MAVSQPVCINKYAWIHQLNKHVLQLWFQISAGGSVCARQNRNAMQGPLIQDQRFRGKQIWKVNKRRKSTVSSYVCVFACVRVVHVYVYVRLEGTVFSLINFKSIQHIY